MVVTNTHTFEQGETFKGQIDDEEITIRDVRDHTIVWDYIVNGETIGRNTMGKDRARSYIQYGFWKPLPENL